MQICFNETLQIGYNEILQIYFNETLQIVFNETLQIGFNKIVLKTGLNEMQQISTSGTSEHYKLDFQ